MELNPYDRYTYTRFVYQFCRLPWRVDLYGLCFYINPHETFRIALDRSRNPFISTNMCVDNVQIEVHHSSVLGPTYKSLY